MQDLRAAIDGRLLRPPSFPEGRFADRGIVICAGGQRYFTCAWILIAALQRGLKTKLPIQVWHLGRTEMSEAMQVLLEAQNVEVVNAETVLHRHPAMIDGGWPLKPYAIAHSRFREVIFLDADTVPLMEPAELFRWEPYRRAGLLLWPDVIDLRRTNPIWNSLGLEPRKSMSVDSGVLVIDKAQHWSLLDVAILLNERWRESYRYLHGDKDTFLIAALLTGANDFMIGRRPLAADGDLIQRNLEGDPFLQHRTGSKWKLHGPNHPVIVPELNRCCEEAMAELHRVWSGTVFHPPERSARARAAEAELIATRWFRYAVSNGEPRILELRRGGAIGEGRANLEQHWAIIEREGHLVLQFFSGSRLVIELLRQSDGSWCGVSIGTPGFDAKLIAEQDWQTLPHANGGCVAKSAEEAIGTLLDTSLFGAGFDLETAQGLQSALSLLNRVCDDVPEQLSAKLAGMKLSQDWRSALEAWAKTLKQARDARRARASRDLIPPVIIDPRHYTRVF
jgi:hypothetical protein